MDVRPHERSVLDMVGHVATLENSIAITGIADGRVVCCGGIIPFGNGNAEIWLIPSIYVKDYKVLFCKELGKWLFGLRTDLSLNRMQTSCIDDATHTNWMEYLGFTKEGTMRRYFNGVDYNMWGKVWE